MNGRRVGLCYGRGRSVRPGAYVSRTTGLTIFPEAVRGSASVTTRDYVSTVEEPAYWTQERASRVARAVVDALMDA